jgi:hypothetical protein
MLVAAPKPQVFIFQLKLLDSALIDPLSFPFFPCSSVLGQTICGVHCARLGATSVSNNLIDYNYQSVIKLN